MAKSSGMYGRERIASQGNSQTIQQPTQNHQVGPRPHSGPFNVKCLFMENAQSLILKIG